MSSTHEITVTGLGPTATEPKIMDFFNFCGKVSKVDLHPDPSGTGSIATVVFNKPAAIKTALLLTDSEFEGAKIHVQASPEAIEASEKDVSASSTGVADDVNQEDKPKAAIFAEYLSHGYVLGDKVIAKGLEVDQKHGISQRFSSFLSDIDTKYHVSDKADATNKAYGISDKLARGHSKLARYFDQALNTETGSKIREYYTGAVKNVQDVHTEARRLADIKEKESGPAAATGAGAGATDAPTGAN